jgi:hypothetical protein
MLLAENRPLRHIYLYVRFMSSRSRRGGFAVIAVQLTSLRYNR